MTSAHDYTPKTIEYPREWEDEYRRELTVARWLRDFPDLSSYPLTSTRRGTLDLFAQYALMYLLAENEGVSSITWLYLAAVDNRFRARVLGDEAWTRPDPNPKSKNRDRIKKNWDTMRVHMGDKAFDKLQAAIVRSGFTGFRGEPDLFCYAPDGSRWFFAEAKRKDRITKSQVSDGESARGWFDVAKATLGKSGRVGVYELVPSRG
jgi:hypothetical protein